MRRQEQVGGRSVEPIHAEQQQLQQDAQAETVFFSHGSMYAVGAMLTLAVLFCAGVLAYTVRRNDMLKTEYHRLMAAIADRIPKSSRLPTETDPTETMETMGPAPRVDDETQDAVLLLLTHKPISNIKHPGRTRSTTTAPLRDGETLYDDDLEGGPRRTLNGTRTATRRTYTASNYSASGTSSSGPVTPEPSATSISTTKPFPSATRQTALDVRNPPTTTFMSTERTAMMGSVTRTSQAIASDSDRNSTHISEKSAAVGDEDGDAGDDA